MNDSELHQSILKATRAGVWQASERTLSYSVVTYDGSEKYHCIADALARSVIELGFSWKTSGLQIRLDHTGGRYCRPVRLILVKGERQDFSGYDVFSINRRGKKTVRLIATNHQQSGIESTLFSMDDLLGVMQGGLFPYDEVMTLTTFMVVWEIRGNGKDEDTELLTYLARPVAIDSSRTLIQCEPLLLLGSQKPFDLGAFEPKVQPRTYEQNIEDEYDPQVIPITETENPV